MKAPRVAKKKTDFLVPCGGRIGFDKGNILYTSIKDLKRLISAIGTGIDNAKGFIVPIPKLDGPVWNKNVEKFIKKEYLEHLYDLFDEEKEVSATRAQYYLALSDYIIAEYMKPQKEYLESIGKEVMFDMGEISSEYYSAGGILNPVILKNKGYRLLGREEQDFDHKIPDILLISPTRGIMERYVNNGRKRNRIETPALLAEIESEYYCEMMKRGGYSFSMADEISFLNDKNIEKYAHILVCESCLFSQEEREGLNKLEEQGVKINDRDLIYSIAKKGEE